MLEPRKVPKVMKMLPPGSLMTDPDFTSHRPGSSSSSSHPGGELWVTCCFTQMGMIPQTLFVVR